MKRATSLHAVEQPEARQDLAISQSQILSEKDAASIPEHGGYFTVSKFRRWRLGGNGPAYFKSGEGEPSVEKLYALLSYYGVSLGEFFRFTTEDVDGKLVADFLEVIRRPGAKKTMRQLIKTFLER